MASSRGRWASPERTVVWTEPPPKTSTARRAGAASAPTKVAVVYYISRNGQLKPPALHGRGVPQRDVRPPAKHASSTSSAWNLNAPETSRCTRGTRLHVRAHRAYNGSPTRVSLALADALAVPTPLPTMADAPKKKAPMTSKTNKKGPRSILKGEVMDST
jgi:hypothetical protein